MSAAEAAAAVDRVRSVLRDDATTTCQLVSAVLLDDETLMSVYDAVDQYAVIDACRRADIAIDRLTSCVILDPPDT